MKLIQERNKSVTYKEARVYLDELSKYGSVLGLDAIRGLLRELGNPQDDLRFIHIAGTNGKGSVLAYTSTILSEAGYRIGRYVSPTVVSYRERIQVDGVMISKHAFAKETEKVQDAIVRLKEAGEQLPTVFEAETAIAFLYYKRTKCDFVVLESGLGGLEDATNVVKNTVCAVFSSISMDHIRFLGNSLSEIATAKSGIIKPQIPVVTMEQQPEAFAQIKKKAEAVDAELIVARADQAQHITQKNGRYAFAWNVFEGVQNEKTDGTERTGGADRSSRELQIDLSLCGAFQVENAVCVLNVLQILQKKYPKITKATIQHGLAHTTWHGRLERLGTEPDFYLDGAHNEDAVRKLRKTLEEGFSDRRIVYIMGVLADKDYEKMIRMMFRPGDHVYTVTPQNPRALDGKELEKQLLEQKIAARYCENVQDAVLYALRDAQKDDMILAFGSLSYLRNVREAYESVMIALEQEKIDL